MKRRSVVARALMLGLGIGAVLAGCIGPHAYVREGDANAVQVVYGGDDAGVALPLARRHCAQYEKIPRFVDAGANLATFDCVPR